MVKKCALGLVGVLFVWGVLFCGNALAAGKMGYSTTEVGDLVVKHL